MSTGPELVFRGKRELYGKKILIPLIFLGQMLLPGYLFWVSVCALWHHGTIALPLAIIGLLPIILLFSLLLQALIAYPEIGISRDHLWYRHLWRWRAIDWSEIPFVDETVYGEGDGLYAYSERLSVVHWLTTLGGWLPARSPFRGRRGRALFISPRLRNYRELNALIRDRASEPRAKA